VRNVLVTGGSRGLGLGIARALAASGFRVIAVARRESPELAAATGRATGQEHHALHFRALDLADTGALGGFVKSLRGDFGAFFGLVNNAGIGAGAILANMGDSEIEQMVRLNVISPLLLTKYIARSMMSGQGGRIVNITSVVASTGYSGLSVYSATKAALGGFTRSLARELGPLGITVNAVAPGFVDTDMTHALTPDERARIERRSALKRMPDVADIANAVDFLFSDKAGNITGTTTTVDAGNTA
jgi:3-oxoacyl-[acyl-carrier protein] reductase